MAFDLKPSPPPSDLGCSWTLLELSTELNREVPRLGGLAVP